MTSNMHYVSFLTLDPHTLTPSPLTGRKNAYITGLTGHYKLPQKVTIGTQDNQQTFKSGEDLFWRVRWDFDPVKGPHVNVQFGKQPSSKFAYKLDQSQWTRTGNEDTWAKKTMAKISKDLNSRLDYDGGDNDGKSEPTFKQGKQQAIEDLKNYFKSVAEGPCT